MPPREILLAAADYIEEHGLRQDGDRGIQGEPCSVVGAMDVVSGHCSEEARRVLMRYLSQAVLDDAGNSLLIDTWGCCRRAAWIIATLRAAASEGES
jgi:hypothetical protein